MIDLLELGLKIKEARRERKITRDHLSAKTGVSRARIEALENLRASDIGFKNLLRVMNAVGLDLRITTYNQNRPTLDDLVEDEERASRDTRMVR